MTFTRAQVPALLANARRAGNPAGAAAVARAVALPAAAVRIPRGMNKLEQEYARQLDFRKAAGEVTWWGFEKLRIRLAGGAWFKPDFVVLLANGRWELHETKGFWREAARVRVKVCAELFPMPVVCVRRVKGRWEYERFEGR